MGSSWKKSSQIHEKSSDLWCLWYAYDKLWHLKIMFSCQHIKKIFKKTAITAQHFQTDTWSMLSTSLDDTSDINDICQACPLTLPGRNTQIVSKRSGQSQDVSRICSVFEKSIMNHCWNTLAGYLWISMDICYLRISGRWFPWPLVGGYVWHRVLIGCKRQVELSLQCILTQGKQLIQC